MYKYKKQYHQHTREMQEILVDSYYLKDVSIATHFKDNLITKYHFIQIKAVNEAMKYLHSYY